MCNSNFFRFFPTCTLMESKEEISREQEERHFTDRTQSTYRYLCVEYLITNKIDWQSNQIVVECNMLNVLCLIFRIKACSCFASEMYKSLRQMY